MYALIYDEHSLDEPMKKVISVQTAGRRQNRPWKAARRNLAEKCGNSTHGWYGLKGKLMPGILLKPLSIPLGAQVKKFLKASSILIRINAEHVYNNL